MDNALILIVAMTRQGVIGVNNTLPWNIPEDLKHFKRVTTNRVVIMGRKTYQSIGKALPNRYNIVVSRDLSPGIADGVMYVNSIDDALKAAKAAARDHHPVFCIGGAEIYKHCLPLADEVIVTWVDIPDVQGDASFPLEQLDEFREYEKGTISTDPPAVLSVFKRRDRNARI